jgi:hypothetical protein
VVGLAPGGQVGVGRSGELNSWINLPGGVILRQTSFAFGEGFSILIQQ